MRRPLDAYYTPDALAESLVGLLPIDPRATVLEPHAGGGAFVRALLPRVATVYAADINAEAPGLALCPSSVGPFVGSAWTGLDWIVGNPPFTDFHEHVDHALKLASNVVFLLRLAVMESERRAEMWRRWPLRRVWVLASRPSFTGTGTDSAAYGWFWFQRGYGGTAEVVPGWAWRRAAP